MDIAKLGTSPNVDALMGELEKYDFLGEDWLKDKPYRMRVILGREDFLNKPAGAMNWAKT